MYPSFALYPLRINLLLALTHPPPGGVVAVRSAFRVSRSNIVAFTELLILPSSCHVDSTDTTLLLCLTAWLIALQQTVGLADFVVGVVLSVRDLHPTGVRGLLAPLGGVFPLRVRLSRASSFVDLFMDVGRSVYLARTHAQYPVCPPYGNSSQGVYPVQVRF